MRFIGCGKPDTFECLIEIQRRHHRLKNIQHFIALSLLLIMLPCSQNSLIVGNFMSNTQPNKDQMSYRQATALT